MDLPVCIAYLVLRFDVSAPLQEEGDCLLLSITGRLVEGCPIKLQQQRDRDSSGQVKKGTEGQVRFSAVRCGRK